MKINTKRILMIVLLLGGISLDCLCMLNFIPLGRYRYSFILVFIALLIGGVGEKSRHYSELTPQEKNLAGMTIVLSFAWVITFIACIAYQL